MSKRIHRSQQQWQEHINVQQSSGLSITAYCQQHRLTTSNFYNWRSKLKAVNEIPGTRDTQDDADWLAIPTEVENQPELKTQKRVLTLSLPGGITLTLEHF